MSGLTLAVMLLPDVAIAQGCAMCKTAIGGGEDPLAAGLNTSILFLMSMPFLLTATVGGWIGYVYWRSHAGRQSLRLLRVQGEESL